MRSNEKGHWWVAVIVLPFFLPLIIYGCIRECVIGAFLYLSIWFLWCRKGKHCLVIHSNSPNWEDYLKEHILPRLRDQAVLLNWSERSQWKHSLATRVFEHFRGDKDFNPMVLIFRPWHKVVRFQFRPAFQKAKHGDSSELEQITGELFELLTKIR